MRVSFIYIFEGILFPPPPHVVSIRENVTCFECWQIPESFKRKEIKYQLRRRHATSERHIIGFSHFWQSSFCLARVFFLFYWRLFRHIITVFGLCFVNRQPTLSRGVAAGEGRCVCFAVVDFQRIFLKWTRRSEPLSRVKIMHFWQCWTFSPNVKFVLFVCVWFMNCKFASAVKSQMVSPKTLLLPRRRPFEPLKILSWFMKHTSHKWHKQSASFNTSPYFLSPDVCRWRRWSKRSTIEREGGKSSPRVGCLLPLLETSWLMIVLPKRLLLYSMLTWTVGFMF